MIFGNGGFAQEVGGDGDVQGFGEFEDQSSPQR